MRLGITLAEGDGPSAWLYFVISQVKDSHLPIVPVTCGVIPSLHGTSLQCWLLEVTPVVTVLQICLPGDDATCQGANCRLLVARKESCSFGLL